MQRARGHARIALRFDDGATRLWEFYQQGCCKIRLPRPELGGPMQAVLLNTSGGITGGDHLEFEVDIGEGTEAVVTTQAAERIYRSPAGPGFVINRLTVANGATLDWLPQETILFDRSGLDRRLEVELTGNATALLAETIVFGRGAMGETVRTLSLADRWRVRRDGRLIFADGIVLDGDAATILGGGATGGGATAIGSLLYAAPDAPAHLGAIRDVFAECVSEAGASAWPGLLNMRFVAQSSQILRQDLRRVVEALRGRPLPRVWHC
ncbi:urease accessory protein UreD [Kaistia algarum]|uniref:urease accessory protein UreD n=1 Tax=Kaistia algarum TaxID=2083279 RepID=UPI00225365BA|nr:urease accessory protein UreD [Kaistia algarum]MCX5514078.1 urease accessory protein UreD [Kaistia algarum]